MVRGQAGSRRAWPGGWGAGEVDVADVAIGALRRRAHDLAEVVMLDGARPGPCPPEGRQRHGIVQCARSALREEDARCLWSFHDQFGWQLRRREWTEEALLPAAPFGSAA